MGGTLGWILAAWPFTFILVDWDKVQAANPQGMAGWIGTVLANGLTGPALQNATKWTYVVAGVASLVLAAFSLTLPHTPPKKAGEGGAEKLAWLEAVKLLRASLCARAVARDVRGCRRAQLLFQLGGLVSRRQPGGWRRRHSRQLDHAGDERRPDCGAADDVYPRRDA